METSPSIIELLFEKAEAYGKTTYELNKLKALEQLTNVVSPIIPKVIVSIMIFLFVFFLNIGIALLIGHWTGKYHYGFFIIAAFYLVAGIVLHLFLYKWIKNSIKDLIITQLLQ